MRKVTKKSAAAVAAAGSPRNNNEKSKKDGDAVDSTNSDSSPPDPQNEDPHVQKRDPHSGNFGALKSLFQFKIRALKIHSPLFVHLCSEMIARFVVDKLIT